jgi:tRNA(fMet)-specific endonuclease VapC
MKSLRSRCARSNPRRRQGDQRRTHFASSVAGKGRLARSWMPCSPTSANDRTARFLTCREVRPRHQYRNPLLKGDERVLSHLADVEPSDVGIPLLVLAELLFGAEKSVRKEQNGALIKQMAETFPMLPLGLAVVRRYATERAQLERSGRKKSDFDLMIACTAIEHEATLVTRVERRRYRWAHRRGLARFFSLTFLCSMTSGRGRGDPTFNSRCCRTGATDALGIDPQRRTRRQSAPRPAEGPHT